METKQKSVRGTDRTVLLSRTNNDELTTEVHCIGDFLKVPCEDQYIDILNMVVNVGFPATTLMHGPQPEESQNEWRRAIYHIIEIWRPRKGLLIRSSDSTTLHSAISREFIDDIQRTECFDVGQGRDVCFFKM